MVNKSISGYKSSNAISNNTERTPLVGQTKNPSQPAFPRAHVSALGHTIAQSLSQRFGLHFPPHLLIYTLPVLTPCQ